MKPIELLGNPKHASCKHTIGNPSHYGCKFDATHARCEEYCTVWDWEKCPYNEKRFKDEK